MPMIVAVFFDMGSTLGDVDASFALRPFPDTTVILRGLRSLGLRLGVITNVPAPLDRQRILSILDVARLLQFLESAGYLAYGDGAANVLYHVVNDRHIRRRAMVFTTNKHPKRWGLALHDEDFAEAIVDRILERGRLLRLDGPSVRTKHLPGDELAGDDLDDSSSRRVSGTDVAEFPERTTSDQPNITETDR